jgi:hypothetical protein
VSGEVNELNSCEPHLNVNRTFRVHSDAVPALLTSTHQDDHTLISSFPWLYAFAKCECVYK